MVSLDLSFQGTLFWYQTQDFRLSIMSAITKNLKVGSEEGQIFKCSLHKTALQLYSFQACS